MFYTAFDHLLPSERREESKGKASLLPDHLRPQIDEMNEWVYHTINNGVYKTGFASTQEAYDANVYPIFESLDRLEKHLADPGHQPYLFGESITEADIRLYTTLIRFDVAYFTIFKCNLKMIRYEYPNLHRWLRNLYWDESESTNGGAFKKTTRFQEVSIWVWKSWMSMG
jgi:putative glutathione S-transferase